MVEKSLRVNKRYLYTLQTSIETVQTVEKRARRGRPRKDEPAPETMTQYRIQVNIGVPSQKALEAWWEKEETFVLMTDIRDAQRLTDEQVLRLYKGQGEAVEAKFRYLKSHSPPFPLDVRPRVRDFHVNAALFFDLSHQCIHEVLTHLDLSSGKYPAPIPRFHQEDFAIRVLG